MFLSIFEREREHEQGRDRRRGTEDRKQALCWQQRAWCGARTHKPWYHDLSRMLMLNRLSYPGAPTHLEFLNSPSSLGIQVYEYLPNSRKTIWLPKLDVILNTNNNDLFWRCTMLKHTKKSQKVTTFQSHEPHLPALAAFLSGHQDTLFSCLVAAVPAVFLLFFFSPPAVSQYESNKGPPSVSPNKPQLLMQRKDAEPWPQPIITML